MRYIVKYIYEPMRGQCGKIKMYYVYDTKLKCNMTGTCPVESDAKKLADFWNKGNTK